MSCTHFSAPICDGDIKASTHVWASLWISIIEGLQVVTVFLVLHISCLYKNVLPAGSVATYLFSRFKVAYILFVVLCASGIVLTRYTVNGLINSGIEISIVFIFEDITAETVANRIDCLE